MNAREGDFPLNLQLTKCPKEIDKNSVHPPIYPPIRPPTHLYIHPVSYSYIDPSIRPSVRPSVRSSIRPSARPSIHPFINPSIHRHLPTHSNKRMHALPHALFAWLGSGPTCCHLKGEFGAQGEIERCNFGECVEGAYIYTYIYSIYTYV